MNKISALVISFFLLFITSSQLSHANDAECWNGSGNKQIRACTKILKTKRIYGEKISTKHLATVHYYLALGYKGKRRFKNMLSSFAQSLKYNPENENIYLLRGEYYLKNQNYDQGIKDSTKALELNPKSVMAYNNRAYAYLGKNQFQLALSDYNKALKIDSKFAIAYSNRGIVYDRTFKYDKAIADYNKAISLKPDHAKAYYNRGVAYYKLNKTELAKADLNKTLELNPNHKPAKSLLKVVKNSK